MCIGKKFSKTKYEGKTMKRICIISDDKRYITTRDLFLRNGYECEISSASSFHGADVIILSVKDELSDRELQTVFSLENGVKAVFCGNGERIKNFYGGFIYDYSKDKSFVMKNAFLTAEAARILTSQLTGESLFGKRAFVIGYGRIGKFLCRELKNCGAAVYVWARRKESISEAELSGAVFRGRESIAGDNYDFIYNTVPEIIIPGYLTDKVGGTTFAMELASSPGGFEDKSFAEKAPGLPGKILPVSAGRVVFDTVYGVLSDMASGKDETL